MSAVDAVDRFAQVVAAALLIGLAAEPDADLVAAERALDELATRAGSASPEAAVAATVGDGGLTGDRRTYYDPANSYLHRVLERRRGIPVTLAVAAAGVGRRLGVPLDVVGMPGHVLLGSPDRPGRWWDPFDGGRALDLAAVTALHARVVGGELHPSLLSPLDAHQVLIRMLNNLRGIAAAAGDRIGLARTLALRNAVPGVPVAERVELATALAAGGRFGQAADLLDALAGEVEGPEARRLQAGAVRLRARSN